MKKFKITEEDIKKITIFVNEIPCKFGRPILNFLDEIALRSDENKVPKGLKKKKS